MHYIVIYLSKVFSDNTCTMNIFPIIGLVIYENLFPLQFVCSACFSLKIKSCFSLEKFKFTYLFYDFYMFVYRVRCNYTCFC